MHVIFFRHIKQKKYGCVLVMQIERPVICESFVTIQCWIQIPFLSFDGKNFDSHVDAIYEHYAKLGSYNGEPFVTGGANRKTEIFNNKAGKWTEVEDYPYASTL